MKKILSYLILGFLALKGAETKAQEQGQECNIKYNLYKGDYKTKKYEEAKAKLEELMKDCPKLSVNIYVYGSKIAAITKNPALMKRVYEARIKNFPNRNVAKAHNDYARFLTRNKLGTEDEIFEILSKGYKSDPTSLGVRNIYLYFEGVLKRNKDTNPQFVFDTYDDVVEAIGEKLEDYRKRIASLKAKEKAGTINKKEERNLKAYINNSDALGQVEGGLDIMLEKIATCETLAPIYSRDYETKKDDVVWLKRAVSRMHHKGCQSDSLYEKIVLQYAHVAQTADAFVFAAGVKDKKGDVAGAKELRDKAFKLETDPNKKAQMKLTEAFDASNGGRKSRARSLAREALRFNPNMGKAYLLIASLYAGSANSCGESVFEKRMVYVAALNKAIQAQAVDPGCGAGRFIAGYKRNLPTKKDVFQEGKTSGETYKVGCWIGETVHIP